MKKDKFADFHFLRKKSKHRRFCECVTKHGKARNKNRNNKNDLMQ
jgi:hypothetical protein